MPMVVLLPHVSCGNLCSGRPPTCRYPRVASIGSISFSMVPSTTSIVVLMHAGFFPLTRICIGFEIFPIPNDTFVWTFTSKSPIETISVCLCFWGCQEIFGRRTDGRSVSGLDWVTVSLIHLKFRTKHLDSDRFARRIKNGVKSQTGVLLALFSVEMNVKLVYRVCTKMSEMRFIWSS